MRQHALSAATPVFHLSCWGKLGIESKGPGTLRLHCVTVHALLNFAPLIVTFIKGASI